MADKEQLIYTLKQFALATCPILLPMRPNIDVYGLCFSFPINEHGWVVIQHKNGILIPRKFPKVRRGVVSMGKDYPEL